jgi:hypothetical protein
MEELIRQAFLHVEVIGPHVAEGHYDLVGPSGDIILPQVWETVVEPDWTITMHMWPIPEKPKEPDPPPAEEAPAPPPEEPKKKADASGMLDDIILSYLGSRRSNFDNSFHREEAQGIPSGGWLICDVDDG